MNKQHILPLLLVCLVGFMFAGCQQNEPESKAKKPFYIQTEAIEDFPTTVSISKYGTLVGEETFTLNAQANGRVQYILPKVGDTIRVGEHIIQLSDTVAHYGLQAEQAYQTREKAKIQQQNSQQELDSSLVSAEIALERAKNDLQVSKLMATQQLKQAKENLTAALTSGNSTTALDMENQIESLQTQTQNLLNQFTTQQQNLLLILDDVLHTTDRLLGVSKKYQGENDAFEIYLGAKNTALTTQANQMVRQLYATQKNIKQLNVSGVNDTTIKAYIQKLDAGYQDIDELLTTMHKVLQASVSSRSFPQGTIDGHITAINQLENTHQQGLTSFTSYTNQVTSLLGTDIDIQANQREVIKQRAETQENLAKIQFVTTLINTKNSIFSAEQQLKSAQNTYNKLNNTYQTQRNLLDNSVQSAQLAYQQARLQRQKLTITSPINGVISDILVDPGQEVSIGTPLIALSSQHKQVVKVFVSAEERQYIHADDPVYITYNDMILEGEILYISQVANDNLLYEIQVKMNTSVDILGEVVSVEFLVHPKHQLLPLNIIQHTKDQKGMTFIALSGDTTASGNITTGANHITTGEHLSLGRIYFDIGKTWGEYVEIPDDIKTGTQIITTALDEFDPNLFVLRREGNSADTKENN